MLMWALPNTRHITWAELDLSRLGLPPTCCPHEHRRQKPAGWETCAPRTRPAGPPTQKTLLEIKPLFRPILNLPEKLIKQELWYGEAFLY